MRAGASAQAEQCGQVLPRLLSHRERVLPRTTERLRAGASANGREEGSSAPPPAPGMLLLHCAARRGEASPPGMSATCPCLSPRRFGPYTCRRHTFRGHLVGRVPAPLACGDSARTHGDDQTRRGANPTTSARGPTLPALLRRFPPIPGRRRSAARGGPSKGMRQPLYGSRRSQTRAMARMPPLGRHVVATCTAESPWREDGHGADMSGELASPLRHAQWSTNGPGAAKGALERTTRPFAEAPARSRSVVRGSTRPQRLSGPRKPRPQRLQRPAEAPARSGSSGPRKLLPERARPSRKHLPERARPSRKLRPQSLSRSPEHPLAVAQQPQEHPPAVARSFAEAPARSGSAAAEAPPRSSSAAAEAPARTRSQRLSSRGSTRPLTDPRSARMRPWHSCITGMHQ